MVDYEHYFGELTNWICDELCPAHAGCLYTDMHDCRLWRNNKILEKVFMPIYEKKFGKMEL